MWVYPIDSGIIFGSVLVTHVSIRYFSLLSVMAYVALTALLAIVGLKIYTYVMLNLLKKEAFNPLPKISGKVKKKSLLL